MVLDFLSKFDKQLMSIFCQDQVCVVGVHGNGKPVVDLNIQITIL